MRAKWQDNNTPNFVNFSKVRFNAFEYSATDNLGIVAWALTTGEGEPADWHTIASTTSFSGIYELTDAAEEYSFWIKDANENVAYEKLIGRLIDREISAGIIDASLTEDVAETPYEVGDFVLDGTRLTVHAGLDSHYQNMSLSYTFEGATGEESTVYVNDGDTIPVIFNMLFKAVCTPKEYTVKFNVNGKSGAVTPDDAAVVYLTKIAKPLEQFVEGEIITGWYLDSACTQPWDFENDILTAEFIDNPDQSLTLYAKWEEYTDPSLITIVIPEDGEKTVTMHFSSMMQNQKMRIDFGDGTGMQEYQIDNQYVTNVSHTYAATGEYVISIGPASSSTKYTLGGGYAAQILNPSSYITNVEFAWNVSNIFSYALKESSITKAPITNYITSIGTGAFLSCSKMTTVEITPSVRELGDQAFNNCTALEHIVLPRTLTRIGSYLFYDCTNLKSIELNCEQITKLTGGTFYRCRSLKSVRLPENFVEIESEAFKYCSSLEKVILENENLTTAANNGTFIFQGCDKLNTAGPIGGGYDIEFNWKTEIPRIIFYASSLTEITLPSTLKKINADAFAECHGLQTIELPSGLEYIGANAFDNSGITQITIPFNVTSIGNCFLARCLNLRWAKFYNPSVKVDDKVNVPSASWFIGCNPNGGAIIYIPAELMLNNRVADVFGQYWNYTANGNMNYTSLPVDGE